MRVGKLALFAAMLVALVGVNRSLADCSTNCGTGGRIDCWTEPWDCTIYHQCYVCECTGSCDGDDYDHYWCSPNGLACAHGFEED